MDTELAVAELVEASKRPQVVSEPVKKSYGGFDRLNHHKLAHIVWRGKINVAALKSIIEPKLVKNKVLKYSLQSAQRPQGIFSVVELVETTENMICSLYKVLLYYNTVN